MAFPLPLRRSCCFCTLIVACSIMPLYVVSEAPVVSCAFRAGWIELGDESCPVRSFYHPVLELYDTPVGVPLMHWKGCWYRILNSAGRDGRSGGI